MIVVAISNAEDEEANYMSDLLKSLTSTPSNWSNKTHYCKWNGIVCQSSRVVAINLPSSSLTGTLPSYLSALSNLTHIDLHNNSLTGSLPCLANSTMLETVYLGHNNFTSILDFCFVSTNSLRTLNLSNNLNLVPWMIPLDLSDSSLLHTLDLEATNIIDSLESEMFDWFPSLHTVFLSNNNITGPLPVSLGSSRVRYLRLYNNLFTGTIDVISSMRFLSQVWLNNNRFTGSIPNMSNSTHLFDLQLQSNFLYGLVPPSLFTLSSLNNISLDMNFLQGPIPVFHKGVKATWESNNFCRSDVGPCDPQVMILLEIFQVVGYPVSLSSIRNDACFDGVMIRCQRGKIVSIDLRNQELNGTISPAFAKLSSLVNLTLADNDLTGSIPLAFTTLRQLQLLDVSNNNLFGQLPKFSSKVKLITRGNPFLGQIISQQLGGGQNETASSHGGPSKQRLTPVWIVGMYVYNTHSIFKHFTHYI